MTTEQRAILERLRVHTFDVLSTNYGVPARVLNAAHCVGQRRVEAEYLLLCARRTPRSAPVSRGSSVPRDAGGER